jgi:hypothetical protein
MPMDMDYAHIAGFPPTSSTIYHEGKFLKYSSVKDCYETVEGVFFYERNNGRDSEDNGNAVDVSGEKPGAAWAYQNYYEQHLSTVKAACASPWQLIPLFHYDPRRWRNPSGGHFDEKSWQFGPWDEPFNHVATSQKPGVFIGFKMYPPLGYNPLDPRLPHLNDFYAWCESDGIPILVHCSPGGMTTHEAELYYQLDKADLSKRPDRIISLGYDPCTPIGYFYDNYVHPRNWRPVLMKYPKLKLCLAHYGGDEWSKVGIGSDWVEEITNLTDPNIVRGRNAAGVDIHFENVYTDISCFDLADADLSTNTLELMRVLCYDGRYRHVQDKLMFGVDWYLTLLGDIGHRPSYKEFVWEFFCMMTRFDKDQWIRSSLVNPVTFYGLDNKDLLKQINTSLTKRCQKADDKTKSLLNDNYHRVERLGDQVAAIRKELDKLKT